MEAWDHDREVAREFGGEAEFAKALRMVAPRLKSPSGRARREAKLGGIVLFRGAAVPPDHEPVNYGGRISWTFDRDTAAWFAVHYWGVRGGKGGRPWLFQINVHPDDIVAVHHGRGEAEAIIDAEAFYFAEMTVDIDGTYVCDLAPGDQASAEAQASWQEAADRYEAAKNERERAWLSRLSSRARNQPLQLESGPRRAGRLVTPSARERSRTEADT